ncbi:MAG: PA2779 family protein [Alphaproteobacteria bacterium]|nr:PA2779 family protein [Alphaproteobacteria bacterium]
MPQRIFQTLLAIALITVPIGSAQAALVGTEEVVERQASAEEKAHIEKFLARDEVRRQLIEMGISPEEAERRVGSMTPGEMQRISQNIDALPAGQGRSGSVVLLLLVIILLILVI